MLGTAILGRVKVFDPVAMENFKKMVKVPVEYGRNVYEMAADCDALILVTEWNEFRQPDFARIRGAMKQPVLFDGRNIWDPDRVRELGFTYYGVGRAP